MGQAKNRGTREERVQQAQAREQQLQREQAARRERSRQRLDTLALVVRDPRHVDPQLVRQHLMAAQDGQPVVVVADDLPLVLPDRRDRLARLELL